MALLFLDAQKAFDNISWEYMKNQIEIMSFGQGFINAIKAMYTKQSAKIIINGELTEKIEIRKGTRQGCPLSPLLFILVLETLNRQVRENKEIRGTRIKEEHYKLQAFADDLVFVLEEPIQSAAILLNEIKRFGEVAGLQMNRAKTKFMTKNMTQKQKEKLEEVTNIQITKKIKYLGIELTPRCSTLKEDNYMKLLKNIKMDLEKWENLQLSVLGRIATIKMNILPKLLFLFQNIPIKLENNYFLELNKIVSKFVWGKGKRPRVKFKLLQDRKERGGMGLPNWRLYYQACVLVWMKDWITLKNRRLLFLEGHDLQLGWHAFVWYGKIKAHKYFERHIVRNSLLRTWENVRAKFYRNTPRWVSPIEAFTYPNVLDPDKIVTYRDLLTEEGKLRSAQQLEEHGLTLSWFPYVQLQATFKQDTKHQVIAKEDSEFDKLLWKTGEGQIRDLYKYLLDWEMQDEEVKEVMIKWARNFGYNIELERWQAIWSMKLAVATV